MISAFCLIFLYFCRWKAEKVQSSRSIVFLQVSRKSLPYFDFKQFRVYHDRCAQKVGTDGVVLGAWADLNHAKRILDIGTGSGLIALMAAQREPLAQVVGLDVDEDAVEQASQNVLSSPFRDRIQIRKCDVRTYRDDQRFDAIVCNPPFYTEDTLPPEEGRALARNVSSLPFEELVESASRLLANGGTFCVMLPMSCYQLFNVICLSNGLMLKRECTVQTVVRKAPKRVLICYSNESSEQVIHEQLILQDGNEKSEAYKDLARDFYL